VAEAEQLEENPIEDRVVQKLMELMEGRRVDTTSADAGG
jgi:hypothetical protein